MGPGGCPCPFDHTLQDGVSVGLTEAARSRHHAARNAGPRHPVFTIDNPTADEDDLGWPISTMSSDNSQYQHTMHPNRRV